MLPMMSAGHESIKIMAWPISSSKGSSYQFWVPLLYIKIQSPCSLSQKSINLSQTSQNYEAGFGERYKSHILPTSQRSQKFYMTGLSLWYDPGIRKGYTSFWSRIGDTVTSSHSERWVLPCQADPGYSARGQPACVTHPQSAVEWANGRTPRWVKQDTLLFLKRTQIFIQPFLNSW